MNIPSYPYLPEAFPLWVQCAIRILGLHRHQAKATVADCMSAVTDFSFRHSDSYLMEIGTEAPLSLVFSFDLQSGLCDCCFLFLQGPVPQLGDCVRYFQAHGEYVPGKRCWQLQPDCLVSLDKTGDEVCCEFHPG